MRNFQIPGFVDATRLLDRFLAQIMPWTLMPLQLLMAVCWYGILMNGYIEPSMPCHVCAGLECSPSPRGHDFSLLFSLLLSLQGLSVRLLLFWHSPSHQTDGCRWRVCVYFIEQEREREGERHWIWERYKDQCYCTIREKLQSYVSIHPFHHHHHHVSNRQLYLDSHL